MPIQYHVITLLIVVIPSSSNQGPLEWFHYCTSDTFGPLTRFIVLLLTLSLSRD